MNIFSQYKGLRKENYILFVGRIVTYLGSMIWPVLTLILSQKMGLSATVCAVITIIAGAFLLPAAVIGGKLADHCNKKHVIIFCDIVSIILYIVCSIIPLSYVTVGLMVVAAACQSMEYPAYNALIADITHTNDRERAYSLQYLGSNIGLVISPTIAGFLFADYLWLAFLISGVAIGVSTILIYFKLNNIEPVEENEEIHEYQKKVTGKDFRSIILKDRVLLLYVIIMGLYHGAYLEYGYLMPLDIGNIHGEDGAIIYGSVSSLNCIVVVLFTPILTKLFSKITHTAKSLMGEVFVLVGYTVFLLGIGHIPFYYMAIVLFTFGEILTTIVNGPYISARVPANHRGRMNGLMNLFQNVCQGGCMFVSGIIYDRAGNVGAWAFVLMVLAVAILGGIVLIYWDKKKYSELY